MIYRKFVTCRQLIFQLFSSEIHFQEIKPRKNIHDTSMICMVSVNFCLPFFLAELGNIASSELRKSCKIFHKLQ